MPNHIEAREVLSSYLKLSAIIEQHIPKTITTKLCIRLGDPAKEIVHNAMIESADVIILGGKESKGWRRFVVSTVTDKVIRQAPCPVLAIQTLHN